MSGMLVPRRQPGDGRGGPGADAPKYTDGQFSKAYPVLAEFLQREFWDEQTPRAKGSMILFCEDGVFKACLSDKDADMVAFVSKGSWDALLKAIERGLAENTLDWRLTQAAKARRRK